MGIVLGGILFCVGVAKLSQTDTNDEMDILLGFSCLIIGGVAVILSIL